MDGGPGPLHVVNNYLEAWYSSVFLGGADAPPLPEHTATVSSAGTIGTATLSTVLDLAIGDLVAFKLSDPPAGQTQPIWGVGRVTGIKGNTINYMPLTAQYQSFQIPPMSPGEARWNGDVLHDVEIRGNTIVKRPEWDGYSQPKNWIEVKAGRRITIEGNLMTSGTPTNMTFTVRNQNGSSPWIEISGLTFRYNKLVNFKNPGFGIQLQDNEKVTGQSGNLVIENNLMTASSTDSRAFLTIGGHDVVFSHNTILNAWSLGDGGGLPTQNLTLIDNIVNNGEYGLSCFIGNGARSTCWPGLLIQSSVIVDNQSVGGLSSIYPSGNFFPTSGPAVGWVDPASDNYSLSASSPYKGKASDGTDPGVDMNGLLAALGGAASTPSSTPQTPAPTPTPTRAADTTPPTVAIASPANGATVSGTVGVKVSATDNIGVTMTKYLVDGGIIGGFSPPSMNLSWDSTTVSNGSHMISVVAYDAAGNSSQSTAQVNVATRTRQVGARYINSSTRGGPSAQRGPTPTPQPPPTPQPTATRPPATATPTLPPSPSPTPTRTPTPPAPTPTSTPPKTPTPTATATVTPTPSPTPTSTRAPTSTATAVATPTRTPTPPAPTPTSTPPKTPTPTATATVTPTPSPSAADLVIYRDALATPWSDVSWSATTNFANPSPTFSGTLSIRVDETESGALSIYTTQSLDPTRYQAVDFQVFAASSGFKVSVRLENDAKATFPEIVVRTVPPNKWTRLTIPVSQLDPAGIPFDRMDIRDYTGTNRTYFVDELSLVAK